MKLIIIVIVLCICVLLNFINDTKTYTSKEWDEQCKRDFEKYGPVPEDED